MSESIASILKFERFQFDNINFNRNYTFETKNIQTLNLDFDLNANANIAENLREAVVILNCKVFEEKFKKDDAPFMLDLTLRGYFSCEEHEKLNIQDLQLNAMAILFPYLRQAVTNITSLAGVIPVILPPINVYNYFNQEQN